MSEGENRKDFACVQCGSLHNANEKKRHEAIHPLHELIPLRSTRAGTAACSTCVEFPSLGHFSYSARLIEKSGDNVIVELMDDSVNLLDWGVTLEALQRKARELVGRPVAAPIMGNDFSKGDFPIGSEFKTHAGIYHLIGNVVETMLRGNRLLARIHLSDPDYTDYIPKNLPAVSPAINVLRAQIDYTSGKAKIVATDFTWDHVLFSPKGAYPHAHVLSKCTSGDPACNLSHVFAAAIVPILEKVRNAGAEKVAKVRLAAGLFEAKNLPNEIKRLAAMPQDVLSDLEKDANALITINGKLAGALIPNLGQQTQQSLETRQAIEQERFNIFGITRDAKFLAAALGES